MISGFTSFTAWKTQIWFDLQKSKPKTSIMSNPLCGAQESFEVLLGDGHEYSVVGNESGDEQDAVTTPTSNKSPQSRLDQLQKKRMEQQQARLQKKKKDIDAESDDEDSLADDNELTWRSDPTLSLSDWTIEINVRGHRNSSQVYHVHKSILAVGPKRSNYFATTFLKAQLHQPHLEQPRQQTMQQQQQQQMQPQDDIIGGIEPCDFVQESFSIAPGRITDQQEAVSVAPGRLVDHTDHNQNKSKIELEELAAQAFPVLLDYMYNSTNQLNITTDNATGLHYLSGHLEMKTLRRKVKEFWTGDLTMENLVTYYAHARVFKDVKIVTFAEDYCAQHIFQIPEETVVDILTNVDAHFFLKVVTKCGELHTAKTAAASATSVPDADDDQGPLRLSLLIAVYGNIHKNELTPVMFQKLTNERHLPLLEVKAAKVLLELEDDICGTAAVMTPLKTRAIAIISKSWEESCFEDPMMAEDGDDSEPELALPRLEGNALFEFVGSVLKEAKSTTTSLSQELDLMHKWKEECETSSNLDDFVQKELRETKQKLESVKVATAQVVAQIKKDVEQKMEILKKEKQEMAKHHQEELAKVRNDCAKQILDAKEDQAKDTVELRNQSVSYKTSTLKLSAELSEVRRQLAISKDKLKLQRVAEEGSNSVLKPVWSNTSDDPTVSEEEKKTSDE